jgi:glycosyltransferase involved in cell wall biosynthesis
MKKVLVLAYYFPPYGGAGVQRPLKFVKYLRQFGYEPIVVTSEPDPYYIKDASFLHELPDDITIIRLKSYNILNNILQLKKSFFLLKALYLIVRMIVLGLLFPDEQVLWYVLNRKRVLKLIHDYEIELIYTTAPPYTSLVFGRYLKRKTKDLKWVSDFRDPWLTNKSSKRIASVNRLKQKLGSLRNWIERNNPIKRLMTTIYEKRVIKESDMVLTTALELSEEFRNTYHTNQVQLLTNGYDEDDFAMLNEEKSKSTFSILHYGSLYAEQHPFTFLEGCHGFLQNLTPEEASRVHVDFIGNNAYVEECQVFCEKYGMTNRFTFKQYMDHKTLLQQAGTYSVSLLILGVYSGSIPYPGKTFELMRLNAPILALIPIHSSLVSLLKESKTSSIVDFKDIDAISKQLQYLFTQWKQGSLQTTYETNKNWDVVKQYERRNLTQQLATIFDSLLTIEKMNAVQ